MPSFKCKDLGMSDSFEVRTDKKEELMKLIAVHARDSHNIPVIPPDMLKKIEAAIKP
ncbi:MAG: small metal-binding protein [Chloroflexi bacterium RBG_16_57_8]|nr:MAG: small metal-binding protein [Chloroflexi bacterium RBG_16_57_8]